MKKTAILSMIVVLSLFTGCSKKSPEVDMSVTEAPEMIKEGESTDAKIDKMGTLTVEEQISGLESEAAKIYFDFDQFAIKADMQPKIEFDSKLFNEERAQNFSIKVEGNCDEWGTDEYNYALGLKRAKSVKDALTVQGVDSTRMVVVSYGESKPACEAHNDACWAENRRVEFKLLP